MQNFCLNFANVALIINKYFVSWSFIGDKAFTGATTLITEKSSCSLSSAVLCAAPSFYEETKLLICGFLFYSVLLLIGGPDNSSGKALGYGLDNPGSIPCVGRVEIFLHSFVSRLVLGFIQPPIR